MNHYQLKPIGKIKNDDDGAFIELEPEYIPAPSRPLVFSAARKTKFFPPRKKDEGASIYVSPKGSYHVYQQPMRHLFSLGQRV